MAKLTRGRYIIYIDTSFGAIGGPSWFKVGKSLTSLTVDLNPDVTVEQDIWDDTSATDNGYTPQSNVDPYYANPTDAIYEKIRDIAMNRKTGDACKTKIMEVIVEDDTAETHMAWTEDILVKPTSTGGDTSGFSIPYDIYFDGNRTDGTVAYSNDDYKTGTPTFTANP